MGLPGSSLVEATNLVPTSAIATNTQCASFFGNIKARFNVALPGVVSTADAKASSRVAAATDTAAIASDVHAKNALKTLANVQKIEKNNAVVAGAAAQALKAVNTDLATVITSAAGANAHGQALANKTANDVQLIEAQAGETMGRQNLTLQGRLDALFHGSSLFADRAGQMTQFQMQQAEVANGESIRAAQGAAIAGRVRGQERNALRRMLMSPT